MRRAFALVVVLVLGLAGAQAGSASAPSNDDFGSATVLNAASGSLTQTNTDATKQVGEPDHAGNSGGSSVWYSWTPSFSGIASIDTVGSDFDTLLAVYTGTAVSNVSSTASNDDVSESGSVSRVCFSVQAGSTYMVAVDGYASQLYVGGYHGATGNISLNWGPKNDASPCPKLPPTLAGNVGNPRVGDVLQLVAGSFVDSGPTSTQQWFSCDVSCSAIPGATGSSYVVQPDIVGKTVTAEVTNSDGSTTAHNQSAASAVVRMTPVIRTNGRIYFVTSRVTGGYAGGSDIFSVLPDGSSLNWLTDFGLPARLSETHPAASPQGDVVAFNHNGQLATMAPDGSDAVTLGYGGIAYPAWSPDGSRIAFTTDVTTGGSGGIDVMDADGNVTSLFAGLGSPVVDNIAWSPDGTKIAFGYRGTGSLSSSSGIALISADGRGAITMLTPATNETDHWVSWSPDGTRIAFIRGATINSNTNADLYVMNNDGSNLVKLVGGDATHIVRSVTWSPDATTLLFSREDNGVYRLFTVPAAGGSVSAVPVGAGDGIFASWAALVRYGVDVTVTGSGSGEVTSRPTGLACATTCSAAFDDGAIVTLTASPNSGSIFAGWSGDCGGTATCVVAATHARNVTAQFTSSGGGSGGGGGSSGGGGGGGETSVPNLRVRWSSVSIANPPPGTEVDFTITVDNLGGAGAQQSHLKFTLPSTMKLVGPPYYERGDGCTGTSEVDCNLDYIPNGSSTPVKFGVIVSGSGAQTITASASSDRESDPSDNSATATLQVGTPPPGPTTRPTPKGKTLVGTVGPDHLTGTPYADVLKGGAGNDVLRGGAGDDILIGGPGKDAIYGGPGNDSIRAHDGVKDTIDCGTGKDTVYADRIDRVAANCETVHRG